MIFADTLRTNDAIKYNNEVAFKIDNEPSDCRRFLVNCVTASGSPLKLRFDTKVELIGRRWDYEATEAKEEEN